MKTKRCYLIRSMTRIIAVLILCFMQGLFAQDCVDVSGTWHVEESMTATISAEGEIHTEHASGTGEITIEQNGCQISFYSRGLSPDGSITLLRQGTVTHDHISFSGRMVAGNPEISCSVNSIRGEGVIEGKTITVTTTGEAVCSAEGISAFIAVSGTAVFTRAVTVELESIEVRNGILIRDIPRIIWSRNAPSQLYPFAASMEQGTVRLHIKLSDVNNNYTYTPTVRCAYSWNPINGNPVTYQYPDEFEGWEGDIDINIPQGANLYDFNLIVMVFYEGARIYEKVIIDPGDPGKGITAYITLGRPLQNVSNPKEKWLEKATLWAQGSSTRATILSSLNLGIYHQLYLGQNERWRYVPSERYLGNWDQLLEGIARVGNCVTFSEVWRKLAELHGIHGTNISRLSLHFGYMTKKDFVALDGRPGMARPAGGHYDRWFFLMHQVGRSDLRYYDPTMGREETFINRDVLADYYIDWRAFTGFYPNLFHHEVAIGILVKEFWGFRFLSLIPVQQNPDVYDFVYYDNSQRLSNVINTDVQIQDLGYERAFFEDDFIAVPIDDNGDGRFERLSVSGQVNIIENGSYYIQGSLLRSEDFITSRSSMCDTTILWHYINESSGLVDIQLFFSGQDIHSSQLDGAYTVNLFMNDVNGIVVDELVFETPAYTASQFGETSADIVGINDSLVDIGGDLIYDALRVEATVNVYQPGNYYLDAILLTPDGTIVGSADSNSVLSRGSQVVTLDFDGREISTIQDPNFLKLEITLNDSQGEQQDHSSFTTGIYDPANFIKKDVSITGPYNDIPYDADSDGLIDKLRVEVGIEVTDPNNYQVAAWLQDSNGCDITTSRSNIDLGVGKQNITIDFEGHKIREHGVDGPYSIIYLLVESSEGIVDSKRKVHFTDRYNFADFNSATGGLKEDFETGDFDRYNWVSFGYEYWIVTSDEHKSGSYSAKAGTIGNNGRTTLELTLDCISGDISFYYKVSSEEDYDYLRFYIDGSLQDSWSGDEDWTQASFPVKAGSRTFEWTYSKDGSSSSGSDTAWIDDIAFPAKD